MPISQTISKTFEQMALLAALYSWIVLCILFIDYLQYHLCESFK